MLFIHNTFLGIIEYAHPGFFDVRVEPNLIIAFGDPEVCSPGHEFTIQCPD